MGSKWPVTYSFKLILCTLKSFRHLLVTYPYLHISRDRAAGAGERHKEAKDFKKGLPENVNASVEQGESEITFRHI